MSTRQVTIVSIRNQSDKVILDTDVATWGELEGLIEEEGLLPENYKAVVKETKNELSHEDAILPEGDFTVWIRQTKMKSAEIRNMKGNFASPEDALESAFTALEEAQATVVKAQRKISECTVAIASKAGGSATAPEASTDDLDDVDEDVAEAESFFND